MGLFMNQVEKVAAMKQGDVMHDRTNRVLNKVLAVLGPDLFVISSNNNFDAVGEVCTTKQLVCQYNAMPVVGDKLNELMRSYKIS